MTPNPVLTGQIISEAEVDRSLFKIFILTILTVAASFLAVYSFSRFLLDSQSSYFPLSLLGAVLFLIFVILDVFFIKSFPKIIFLSILASFAPLALFYPSIKLPLIIGAALFFIFLINAFKRGVGVIGNFLRLRFFTAASFALPKAVTGLLIFFALIFFTNYFNVDENKFNENINRLAINQIVIAGEPAVKIFLPKFSSELSADEFLKMLLNEQITSLVPDFERYLPAVRERIFNETFNGFKERLEKVVGTIEGDEPLSESLYFVFERYLDGLPETTRLIFAVVFTFVVFLLIKGIVSLFHWLIESLAFLIFKILIISGFAYISLENRSREFVALT